jgi:hypothetical protein
MEIEPRAWGNAPALYVSHSLRVYTTQDISIGASTKWEQLSFMSYAADSSEDKLDLHVCRFVTSICLERGRSFT